MVASSQIVRGGGRGAKPRGLESTTSVGFFKNPSKLLLLTSPVVFASSVTALGSLWRLRSFASRFALKESFDIDRIMHSRGAISTFSCTKLYRTRITNNSRAHRRAKREAKREGGCSILLAVKLHLREIELRG